jgi:uncharacterized protein (TIGR03086 family)
MDGITALDRSYAQAAKLVANLGSDQLSAGTPCAGWDVATLLNHTFGAGWMFTLVNQGQSVGGDAGDVIGGDPAGALEKLATANLASWRQPGALEGDRTYPFGTFPAGAGLMINLGEVVLHGWDLAKATGQDSTIDPELAAVVYGFYRELSLDEYRAHGAFGPDIYVPETAPTADRLLGYLGRQP